MSPANSSHLICPIEQKKRLKTAHTRAIEKLERIGIRHDGGLAGRSGGGFFIVECSSRVNKIMREEDALPSYLKDDKKRAEHYWRRGIPPRLATDDRSFSLPASVNCRLPSCRRRTPVHPTLARTQGLHRKSPPLLPIQTVVSKDITRAWWVFFFFFCLLVFGCRRQEALITILCLASSA